MGGEHLDPMELVGFARGTLRRPDATRVREHCRTCVDCGDQLAAVMLLRRRAGLSSATPWRSYAAAAGVVIAVLAAFGAVALSGATDVQTEPTAVAADLPTGDLDASWTLREDARVRLGLSMLGSRLSSNRVAATDSPNAAAAGQALAAGDYAAAADLVRTDPSGSQELLGIVLYMDGRAAEAREVLEPVVSRPGESFSEQSLASRLATAVLAASYFELGDAEAGQRFLADFAPPPEGESDAVDDGLRTLRGDDVRR